MFTDDLFGGRPPSPGFPPRNPVDELAVSVRKNAADIASHAADADAHVTAGEKAAWNAKADLVGGKVPQEQLPSYVDDVLEYAALSSFPQAGETGKIYVDTSTGRTYRWSGSGYVPIGGGEQVQADWIQTDVSAASFIKNKPPIPAAVTVDSALSDSSENPVQNKVVKAALDARPAKAQMDEGWWSEWTIVPDTPAGEKFYIVQQGQSQWNVWLEAFDGDHDRVPDWQKFDTVCDKDDTLNMELLGTTYTATRHRVAAPVPTKTSQLTNDSGFLTSHQDITGKEDKSNKTASFSQTPGDVKYPTEKLLKDSLDANAAAHRYALNMAEPDVTYTAWSVSPSTYRLVFYGGQWLPVDTVYTGDYFPGQESGDPAGDENSTSLSWATGDPEAPGAVEAITATRTPTGASVTLQDRAINVVSLSTTATMTMPAAILGHARDLVVRLIVGAADLNITWGTADADGVAVDYETEDGEFPDLSAAGTYLVRLTETVAFAAGTGGAADVPAKFLIQCQPLQTAVAGGGV